MKARWLILLAGVAAYPSAAGQGNAAQRANPAAAAPARKTPAPAAKAVSAAPAASWKDLKYPPLGPIRIPDVTTFTLPNGMKVFLLEDHELPVVSGTARIRTGNLFDPPDKVGLAGVAGRVMRTGGTKAKTGDQLDEQLENIAASVESSIGETSGSVSCHAMKENAGEVLEVFRDVLTAAEFRQDRIDLEKSQIRSAISRRNDDAGGVAQREFSDLVYGRDTPYGWRIEYATAAGITRADVLAFYKRYFFPANILLAVWGDFDTAQMKARLETLFGGWTYQQPPVPPFPKVRVAPEPGLFVAGKEDVTQTFFAVGHLGGELRDKDFPALEVMADILGGGFRSRLVQRVRSKLGNAYDISASWSADYDHPGLFEITGSTKSVATVETLAAVREEIERIRTTEVSDSELETAKQTALNSLVFAFDSKAKTLARMLNYEYYGYPRDFIQQYQKALAAVTGADVLRAAKEHLNPKDLTTVAVGRGEELTAMLGRLGQPLTPIDLTIPEPKATSANVDAASLEQGLQLLRRAQQAVGGADRLAGVKDAVEVSGFQVDPAAGGMRVEHTSRWIAPEQFREESQMSAGKIVAYSDGKSGWIVTPQGTGPLTGPQLKQVQGNLFRFYFRLLLSDRIPGRQVNYVGENTVEISGESGESARLVVNPDTGLPDRVTYEAVHTAGPQVMVEERYTRFGEVAGVKLPFAITILQGGRNFAEVSVKDYKVNTGLKVEDLRRRP